MTKKATPPSFIEGWERIPGASNYEINAEEVARHSGSKKVIASPPDAEGNVLIFGDEKRLEKFNLKKIAAELFPVGKRKKDLSPEATLPSVAEALENPVIVAGIMHDAIQEVTGFEKAVKEAAEKIEIVETKNGKPSNELNKEEKLQLAEAIAAHDLKNQQSQTTKPMKNTAKKKVAKKAPLKAAAPKKAQTPKAGAKAPQTKKKTLIGAELAPTAIKAHVTTPATAEEKKIAALKCMYAIKVWKLHKLGRTPKEIMIILNRPDKQTSTPMAIERYKANKKLQNRADLVKVD